MDEVSPEAYLSEWIIDKENNGTLGNSINFPFFKYSELVTEFIEEFYQFSYSHPEYKLIRYDIILKRHNLKLHNEEIRSDYLQELDEQDILALIMRSIQAERFCEGALLEFIKDGSLTVLLKRLKDIDKPQ
ncbi:MAG: DUF6508 domain-containing protein [Propionibacteriaceae bacterium]